MQKAPKPQGPKRVKHQQMPEPAEGMQSFHDGSSSPFSYRQTQTRMGDSHRASDEDHVETRGTNKTYRDRLSEIRLKTQDYQPPETAAFFQKNVCYITVSANILNAI